MIRHEQGKWILYTADGSKRLGTHDTEAEAQAQERAVEASKHRNDDSVTRIDVLRLDGSRAERTPQGGLRVPANLTRTGVFVYRNQDGSQRREYRPPTEVFDSDSLASLEDAPVTDGHQGMVRADSYQSLSKGHVRNIRKDAQFVAGVALVQDAALVAAVERGDRAEISCGYECKLDMSPGITPEGEHYDAVQTRIRYNHAALLPRGTGRAGREVALRLDGASYVVLDDMQDLCQNKATMLVRFDGKDYDLSKPAEKLSYDQAVIAGQTRLDALTAELATAKTSVTTLTAERDAAIADRDAARADAADARDPVKLAARVEARTALEARAREFGVEKFDGLTDEQIREACVTKNDAQAKTAIEACAADQRATYVRARFDSLAPNPAGSVRAAMVASTLPGAGSASAPASLAPAHVAPLAMSKDRK